MRAVLRRAGYDMVRRDQTTILHRIPEMSPQDLGIWERVKPMTMTSAERIWSCIQAARYVSKRGMDGAFVECGVWRGGSSMAAALTFLANDASHRDMWLFDTYEGMNRPDDRDRKNGETELAAIKWEETKTGTESSDWCMADLADVRANMESTGYPMDKVRFIKGPVEETLADAANVPDRIAMLRLDTDWYESTRVELDTLFDKVIPGGIVILDDYGEWAGAKQATDEYFDRTGQTYLLNRIDRTGRLLIKA